MLHWAAISHSRASYQDDVLETENRDAGAHSLRGLLRSVDVGDRLAIGLVVELSLEIRVDENLYLAM